MTKKQKRIVAFTLAVTLALSVSSVLWFRHSLSHMKVGFMTTHDVDTVIAAVSTTLQRFPQTQAVMHSDAPNAFVGTWRTRKSPVTYTPDLTVNVVQTGGVLSGTALFVGPDGSSRAIPFDQAVANAHILSFATNDGGLE